MRNLEIADAVRELLNLNESMIKTFVNRFEKIYDKERGLADCNLSQADYDNLVRDAMNFRNGLGMGEFDRMTAYREAKESPRFDLLEAVEPFAELVNETSGKIPFERLSFANWHALAKAYNAIRHPDKEQK
jgi:hypothetical protein